MTGTVRFTFTVETLAEAKEKALAEWRKFINDESADLPWESDMTVTKSNAYGQEGRMEALVTIELDDIDTYLAAAET